MSVEAAALPVRRQIRQVESGYAAPKTAAGGRVVNLVARATSAEATVNVLCCADRLPVWVRLTAFATGSLGRLGSGRVAFLARVGVATR